MPTRRFVSAVFRLCLAGTAITLLAGCASGAESSIIQVSPTKRVADAVTRQPDPTPPPESSRSALPAPAVATAVPTTAPPVAGSDDEGRPDGALIQVSLSGRVGVLLDELPPTIRDRVAESLIAQKDDFWLERARRQLRLTYHRLNFRNFVYRDKGQLPLPPAELWEVTLTQDVPMRVSLQGHDLVMVDYAFEGVLLTDSASPEDAEPELAEIGGIWLEPFIFPADPELLLQRTGNACVNESGFPPNSFDSENVWIFYDHACTADSGGPAGCHRTRLPNDDCVQALASRVGQVETAVRFERLAWDEALADQVRMGEVLQAGAPDLAVRTQDLEDNRIIYRYFSPDACALVEACVGGSGWRRLLQFSATVHNVGNEPLHIGPVTSEDPDTNLFQYNVCHDHFHFSNYGDFEFGSAGAASKQAFCVESTSRYSNNEFTPLTHPYSCSFQGVQTGWGDEYGAGLDCQWMDITDVAVEEPSETFPLTFNSNSDQFLCEGSPVLDDEGEQLWEPSGLQTEDGHSIERPACEFVSDWDANNTGTVEVALSEAGSFITELCEHGELGPWRNCGFTAQQGDMTCTPGQRLQLSCQVAAEAPPQVLRVCESSHELGTGTACVAADALGNAVITADPVSISFSCPLPRDEQEPGGLYAFYSAPAFPEDDAAPVTCSQP